MSPFSLHILGVQFWFASDKMSNSIRLCHFIVSHNNVKCWIWQNFGIAQRIKISSTKRPTTDTNLSDNPNAFSIYPTISFFFRVNKKKHGTTNLSNDSEYYEEKNVNDMKRTHTRQKYWSVCCASIFALWTQPIRLPFVVHFAYNFVLLLFYI